MHILLCLLGLAVAPPPGDHRQAMNLVGSLGDDRFNVRQQASTDLEKLHRVYDITPALSQGLASKDLEIRLRCCRLAAKCAPWQIARYDTRTILGEWDTVWNCEGTSWRSAEKALFKRDGTVHFMTEAYRSTAKWKLERNQLTVVHPNGLEWTVDLGTGEGTATWRDSGTKKLTYTITRVR